MPTTRLREERTKRGWSAQDLAQMTGLSPATIYEIEGGRRPPQRTTRRLLAQAFGLPESELFPPREDVPA